MIMKFVLVMCGLLMLLWLFDEDNDNNNDLNIV